MQPHCCQGEVEPLLCSLSDSDAAVKEHAAKCILDIIGNNETYNNAVMEAGGIVPLVRLVANGGLRAEIKLLGLYMQLQAKV